MGSDRSAVKTAEKKPLIKDWEIRLDTWPRRIIAITLVLLTCGILVYRTWWLFLAAWITRNRPADPAIYERAARYDPENADYRFTLAMIYNYSTQHLNIQRAGEQFEAAARLNPHRSSHWLELSKYYEQEGDKDRTRYGMQMALEKDPNYAQTHWAAANLYIRLGDLKTADLELRRTADLDVAYLTQVLDLVWRFYEDPDRIMSTHVPNTKDANLTALNYFISQKSARGAELSWQRLKTFDAKPAERFNYVEFLVGLGKPHEAWRIFSAPAAPSADGFFNPSFETEPLNGGFDWRFSTWEHAEARRDTTTAKDGMASFLVIFSGKENADYSHVWHWLPTTRAKSYVLKFWMKTEAISTDQGVFIEVDGKTTAPQLGTTYWQEFTAPFQATSDLVAVRLRRTPSRKFDNLLKGKVWVDGFSLTEIR